MRGAARIALLALAALLLALGLRLGEARTGETIASWRVLDGIGIGR